MMCAKTLSPRMPLKKRNDANRMTDRKRIRTPAMIRSPDSVSTSAIQSTKVAAWIPNVGT